MKEMAAVPLAKRPEAPKEAPTLPPVWHGYLGATVVMLAETVAMLEMFLLKPLRGVLGLQRYVQLCSFAMDWCCIGFVGTLMSLFSAITIRMTTDPDRDDLKRGSSASAGADGGDACTSGGSGDILDHRRPMIIMCNHLRMSDGFLIASYLHSRGLSLGKALWVSWKGTLNNPHTYMMLARGMPFITKGPSAVKAVETSLRGVAPDEEGDYSCVVFFPEGALQTPAMYASSKRFVEENQLGEHPEHSLFPRPKTFEICVEKLGADEANPCDIIDLTVSYTEHDFKMGLRLDAILDFFSGRFTNRPRRYDMHVRKFTTADIAASGKTSVEWLNDLYRQKDTLISHHKKTGLFPGKELRDGHITPSAAIPRAVAFVFATWAFFKLVGFVLWILFGILFGWW